MQIEFTSRGLLATFFRHKIKLVSFFLVCLLSGIVYALTVTKEYESSGSLLVKFGRSAQPEIAEVKGGPTEISAADRRELLTSYMQILQSRDLIRGLVNEFEPLKLYPDLEKEMRPGDSALEVATTKLLRDSLSVNMVYNSDVIDVHLFNTDPKLATDFLNKLFEQFIFRESDVYNKQQTEFLAEQVKLSQERLHQSQKALQKFKEEAGFSSLDEELERLLEQKKDATNIALNAVDKAKERVEDLEAEEAELLAKYQPDSPAVRQIRQSIAKARALYSLRQRDLTNSTAEEDDNMVSGEIARVKKRIEKLESLRAKHNDLERQVELDEASYKNYVERSEAARVNQIMNEQKMTRITVLDTPVLPTRPARPRRAVIVLIALMAGVLLGVAAAVLMETADDRFSTPAQLANRLQLPVMASFFTPTSGS